MVAAYDAAVPPKFADTQRQVRRLLQSPRFGGGVLTGNRSAAAALNMSCLATPQQWGTERRAIREDVAMLVS